MFGCVMFIDVIFLITSPFINLMEKSNGLVTKHQTTVEDSRHLSSSPNVTLKQTVSLPYLLCAKEKPKLYCALCSMKEETRLERSALLLFQKRLSSAQNGLNECRSHRMTRIAFGCLTVLSCEEV